MPRKERTKKPEEAVEVTITNETTPPVVETKSKTQIMDLNTEAVNAAKLNTKEDSNFQNLIVKVQKALHSEIGKKLNCRVRVLVQDREAVIYQGIMSNIWGRLKANGAHSIYRHALGRVLKEDPNTSSDFT